MIDFEIPEDTRAIRDKVRKFVQEECIPAESRCTADNFEEVRDELRGKARSQGLWCPFVPEEHGGMGLRPLANALVQMELGESFLGAQALNTQGPDDATMLTLLEHGTDDQKERFLGPLLNGEKRICYSMTEKAAGADATGTARRSATGGGETLRESRRRSLRRWREERHARRRWRLEPRATRWGRRGESVATSTGRRPTPLPTVPWHARPNFSEPGATVQ